MIEKNEIGKILFKEINEYENENKLKSKKYGREFDKTKNLNRKITLLELKQLSKLLSLNKATGPDEMTNEILKELIEIIGE